MIEAPHLAQIANALQQRPDYLAHDALQVDGTLFIFAEREYEDVMRERGFPIPRAYNLDKPHFLLNGICVYPVEH